MKFVYLTTKQYPSATADHFYIESLARAFANLLGAQFELVVRATDVSLQGIPVQVLRTPSFLRSMWVFLWLPLYCRRQKEEIIFFSNDRFLLLIALIWKPLMRKPIYIISDWHELFGSILDRIVARGSDLCICTSAQLAQNLVKQTGISQKRVRVVYGGIHLESYLTTTLGRSYLALPEEKTLVGYVGYFTTHGKEKGLRTLIDSLEFLPDNMSIVLVGARDDEEEKYASYARLKGVENRCCIFGAQPFEKIVAYEKAMDVLVIPYPNEPHFREYGFPMKTFEYLAAERPIVYADLPIISEILKERAVPFMPGDPQDLARAIIEAKGRTIDVNATQYSWETKAENIYKAILSQLEYGNS